MDTKEILSKIEDVFDKYRNLLVHEYGKIDRSEVFSYLNKSIENFKLFKKEVLAYLGSNIDLKGGAE